MEELTECLVGLDSTSSTRESTTLDAYRFESGATRAMASAFSQHERRSKLPSALGRTAFPFVFISADDTIPCRIWDETRPRLQEEHRCDPASGLLRAFDEMARFRRSNLQYLIMSHARHGPRGISPWTVWQTPRGSYTATPSARPTPSREEFG